MKKLFENWRRFILLEGFEQDNINALLTMKVQGYETFDNPSGLETFFDKLKVHPSVIVPQIKALRNNKIIKPMGSGQFGITYVLDNDHVIKLFANGNKTSCDQELLKYKEIQDRQFNGKSHKDEPAVYELGEAKTDWFSIFYVELGKVIPFEKWLEINKQNAKIWNNIIKFIGLFFKTYRNQIQQLRARFV